MRYGMKCKYDEVKDKASRETKSRNRELGEV